MEMTMMMITLCKPGSDGLEMKTYRLTCISSVKMCVKPPDWEEGDTFIIHNIQRKLIVLFVIIPKFVLIKQRHYLLIWRAPEFMLTE